MFADHNSLVLRMAIADNIIGRKNQLSDLSGERILAENHGSVQSGNLTEVIRRSRAGDLQAFEELYNLFKRKVYGLAFSITRDHQTAEDLTQDVFIKVFSAIREIDRPELFPAWVYRIALNTCYSYLRREKVYEEKMEMAAPAEEGTIDGSFDSRDDDLARAVHEALARLPEKLRTVFLLHEVEGLTHEEIARMLGCQVGTSKSQLFKARMKLRKILKRKELGKGGVR